MEILMTFLSILAIVSAKFLDQSVRVEESWENVVFGGFRPPAQFGTSTPSDPKIVGGTEAQPGAYPYQVSLQVVSGSNAYHTCGGSIISSNKIACAAHCCRGQVVGNLRVVAGAHNLKTPEGTEQTKTVNRLTIIPNNNPQNMDNDACKIFLTNSLTLNDRVQTIPLCTTEPTSGSCVATGWGLTSSSNTSPATTLQQVNLDYIPRARCNQLYSNFIRPSMLCAGETAGKGGCNGDSGGPLVCTVSGTKCLAGATSWGMQPCAQQQYPTVYANVANLYSFYNSN